MKRQALPHGGWTALCLVATPRGPVCEDLRGPARTCLLQQGVTRLPEPARLVDLGDHGVRANDLTSHWGVEEQPAWEMCPEPKL